MTSILASFAGQVLVNVSEIVQRAAEIADTDVERKRLTLLHKDLEDVHQEMVRGPAFSPRDLVRLAR